MGGNLKFEIPSEIQTIINSNLDNFVASVYIEEKKIDIEEYFKDTLERNFPYFSFDFKVKKIIRTKEIILFKFDVEKFTHQNSKVVKGSFFLIHNLNAKIIFIISPETKHFMDRVIHPFMQSYLYDKISRIYVTSKEIFKILELLEGYLKNPLLSKLCTGTRPFGDHPDKILKWGDKLIPFRECFNLAREEALSINWIRVEAYNHDKKRVLKMDISRGSNISSNLNCINEVYSVLNIIIKKGENDLKILSNKEIKKDKPATPIVIQYDRNILENLETKKKLLETIEKYKECNFSVVHGGNPHIYMYLRDSIDSSSFSLRSVGSDKILLIPQLKATYSSLTRFIHFLTENFIEYEDILEIKDTNNTTNNEIHN